MVEIRKLWDKIFKTNLLMALGKKKKNISASWLKKEKKKERKKEKRKEQLISGTMFMHVYHPCVSLETDILWSTLHVILCRENCSD